MDRRKRILDHRTSEDRRRRWSRHRHRGGTPPPRLAHQLLRPIWMRRTTNCCSRPSSWRRRTGSSGRAAAAAGRGDEGARAMDRHRRRGAQPMDRHRCFPMRGCSFAVQRDACCVHSWHRVHRCGAGSCRVKHNRGLCRTRDPFAVPRLVFVRGYGACTQFRCAGAALLQSGRVLCA